MLVVYVGNQDVCLVKGKAGANELKVDFCMKVPYNEDKQNLSTLLYDAMLGNRISENEIVFVTDNTFGISKYIAVSPDELSVDNAVIADMKRVSITRSDYVISYSDLGEIVLDGERKRNIFAVAAPGSEVVKYSDLARALGFSPKGMETDVSAMSKLVKFLPQVEDGVYSVVMAGEGDYVSVTLYNGKKMLFTRYMPVNISAKDVLDVISLMSQYLARIDKKARISKILYTAANVNSKNLVSIASHSLGIESERLVAGENIKCKGVLPFDDFAFMLGALDAKEGINLFRDARSTLERRKIHVELDMQLDENEIYHFTKRVAAAVYALGGDVTKLNVDKR